MKLLKMNTPQCLLYAFAMVLEISPETLVSRTGATGLEKVWDAPGVFQLRGHHPQEFTDVALEHDIGIVCIEFSPSFQSHVGTDTLNVFTGKEEKTRMLDYLRRFDGVLTGRYTGRPHATAWCHKEQLCYDPNGIKYSSKNFDIHEFWLTYELK